MRREHRIAAALALAGALTGCGAMPTHLGVEAEHVSHPFVGYPFTPQAGCEDGLSHLSGLASWRGEHAYLQLGVGYNLEGRDGGGFYGPAMTGTVRIGSEWRIR